MIKTSDALKIIRHRKIGAESDKSLSKTNRNLIGSLHRLSKMLGCGDAFQTKAGRKFVSRLPEHLRKNNHSITFLKTGHSYSISGNGKLMRNKRLKWLNSGLMLNGAVLTVKVSESPRVARECILSDILQHNVPKKYYVSKQVLERILKQ